MKYSNVSMILPVSRLFTTKILFTLFACAIFLICQTTIISAQPLDPEKTFKEFQVSFPTFDEISPEFTETAGDLYLSKKMDLLGTRITFVVFKLQGKPSLAALVENISLGNLINKLESTPLDALSLENVVIIYNPNLDKTVKTLQVSAFPEPIRSVLKKSGTEFFLRKGVNLVAGINSKNLLDDALSGLKKIGLPLDNLVLESCFGKNSQHLIKLNSVWEKPLGLSLPISYPSIMIRRETNKKTKEITVCQMIWGKVEIDKKEYFLFAERAISSTGKGLGISLALNGSELNLKTIATVVNSLPGKPLSLASIDKLPLDELTIKNPNWVGLPVDDSFPNTKNFLLALSSNKSTTIPNSNTPGPRLVVNGTGSFMGHQLANVGLNLSTKGLFCDAELNELKVGPISMGTARLKLVVDSRRQYMGISGNTGFTIKDFKVANQALILQFNKKQLRFEAEATLIGIGLGKLKGSSNSLKLTEKNSFKLNFSLLSKVVDEILNNGVEAYAKAREKLIKAGVFLSEPDRLIKTVNFHNLFKKENWNEAGGKVKGLYSNAEKTVIAIAAGSSTAISKFVSVANAVGKGSSSLTNKIADGVSYVANKLNPFKKSAKSKEAPKERVPWEFEVVYNNNWVRDQAHRCKTSSSSGSHAEGAVLRNMKNGNYIYSKAYNAFQQKLAGKPMPKIEPYPVKETFLSKKEFMPYWDLDLGKTIPVGAMVIQAGSAQKFKLKPGTKAEDAFKEVLKFYAERKAELKTDGISGAILAVSATVHGNELMNSKNKNVKWYKIPAGSELAIINPMAGSLEYGKTHEAVLKYVNDRMRFFKGSRDFEFMQNLSEISKLNAALARATPKIRYLRIFKLGNGKLALENFSIIHANDTPVTPANFR